MWKTEATENGNFRLFIANRNMEITVFWLLPFPYMLQMENRNGKLYKLYIYTCCHFTKKIKCKMEEQTRYFLICLLVRYAARTGQNGHEHSVLARLDAVFIEL
jgi:hypothetical protein